MANKTFFVCEVHGMCGGVFAALQLLEQTLNEAGDAPVYVLHELVHNNPVTRAFEARGVHFVDAPGDIPDGAYAMIGAHGVSSETGEFLRQKTPHLFDATCPLVKKLQSFAAALEADDQLIIYGKPHHPEVVGVRGHSCAGNNFIISSIAEVEKLPELPKPSFISQTTVDANAADQIKAALEKRFPHIRSTPGVCDASRRRQAAVTAAAKEADLVLIVGSTHSSNACRLREIAAANCPTGSAFLVDGPDMLPEKELSAASRVAVSSGASTPEDIFEKVLEALQLRGFSPRA